MTFKPLSPSSLKYNECENVALSVRFWCYPHGGCSGEAGQRVDVGWKHLPGHHQLGAAEVFVEAVLGDVGHRVLGELDGDPPQQRGGDLAVKRLQRKRREKQRGHRVVVKEASVKSVSLLNPDPQKNSLHPTKKT